MPPLAPSGDPARAAYESLAPFYDRFTAGYEHAGWMASIESWALAEGLDGRRVLDVGCGTGKSFAPLLERGYDVTACDISPAMVELARARSSGAAEVVVADMRDLPWRERFDLITCVDDGINYLLGEDGLRAALLSMQRALRPGGVLVFDTNSLATYRTTFAGDFELEDGGRRFRWRAHGSAAAAPGSVSRATVVADGPQGTHIESRHVQRHWPVAALRAACLAAGLERVAFRGHEPGGVIAGEPDELRHEKVVCLAARPRSSDFDPSDFELSEGGAP